MTECRDLSGFSEMMKKSFEHKESKKKNPTHERWTMCFSLYKNCELKVKLWWVGACERKKESIFCNVYFFRKKFLNIWRLSQCIVYLICFQNIHTFTYQKTLFHILLLLVFKIVESFQCILSNKDTRLTSMTG